MKRPVSEGRPLFNYTTTIQNHMSYTADKYGEGYVFPPVSTTADISPETPAPCWRSTPKASGMPTPCWAG